MAYFAFIPYFLVLDRPSPRDAFRPSYLFGFLYFLMLGYWLSLVNVFGFLLMAAYLALYFGVFGAAAASFLRPKGELERTRFVQSVKSLFFIPAFWVALEYLRGGVFSGMPWALLAYSQWRNILFIQWADLAGAYGVSYFVLWVNLILFKMIQDRKSAPQYAGILIAGVVLVAAYGWMSLRSWDASYSKNESIPPIRVSVLQGNIPQDQKWNSRIKNIIFEKYRRLTLMGAVEKADLIVWPETSFPGYLEDEPMMATELRSLVRQSKTSVLAGAPTLGNLEEGLRFYNSAILYGADGEEVKRYNKLHLVPFGEYIPFEPLLGWLRNLVMIGRFSPGNEKTVFEIPPVYQKSLGRVRFSVLICYEDIFPSLVRGFRRRGADFLVNMTNDAWFGSTAAPYQHAQASVFRAVENRVPVVRSTNTGFSCFISSTGAILSRVQDKGREIFVTGHQTQDLFLRRRLSFYTRFGDVFMAVVFLLCFLAYREKNREGSL